MDTRTDWPDHMDAGQGGGGIGSLLRASRLRRGEELADIAAQLRIRHVYMEAIEEDRFEDLPGHAYVIGFLRAYAEHLGLDGEEVVRRFKAQSDTPVSAQELSFPSFIPEHGIPRGAVLMVGILVAALGYGGWYFLTTADRFQADVVTPVPASLGGTEAADAKASEPAAAESEPSAAVAAETAKPEETAATAAPAEAPAKTETQIAAATPAAAEPAPEAPASESASQAETKTEPRTETAAVTPAAAPEKEPAPAMPTETATVFQTPLAPPAPAPAPMAPADREQAKLNDTPAPAAAPAPPAAPEGQQVASLPAENAAANAAPSAPRIVVHAKLDSWVQIRDEQAGQLLLTRLLKGGDVYEVPDRPGLVLMTGNAGALEITVDGKTVPSIGGVGTVRRHVTLDPDRLVKGDAVVE